MLQSEMARAKCTQRDRSSEPMLFPWMWSPLSTERRGAWIWVVDGWLCRCVDCHSAESSTHKCVEEICEIRRRNRRPAIIKTKSGVDRITVSIKTPIECIITSRECRSCHSWRGECCVHLRVNRRRSPADRPKHRGDLILVDGLGNPSACQCCRAPPYRRCRRTVQSCANIKPIKSRAYLIDIQGITPGIRTEPSCKSFGPRHAGMHMRSETVLPTFNRWGAIVVHHPVPKFVGCNRVGPIALLYSSIEERLDWKVDTWRSRATKKRDPLAPHALATVP